MPLATLNPSRLELLVQQYLEQQQQYQEQHQLHVGQQHGEQQHGEQHGEQQRRGRVRWLPGHSASAAAAEGSEAEGRTRYSTGGSSGSGGGSSGSRTGVRLPTPAELAPADTIFHRPWVCVGTPLPKLVRLHGGQLGELLQQQLGQQAGAAGAATDLRQSEQQQPGQRRQDQAQQQQQPAGGGEGRGPAGQRHMLVPAGGNMHLLLHEQASATDIILGFLHAFVLQHGTSGSISSAAARCGIFSGGGGRTAAAAAVARGTGAGESLPASSSGSSGSSGSGGSGGSGSAEELRGSLAEARRLLPGLLEALEAAGWDDEKVVLEAKRRRVTW